MKPVILCIFIVIILFFVVLAYNQAIKLKNYVKEAFSTMDVYLKKRWDLVPNLVEVTKAYSIHEKTVLEEITKLRSNVYSTLSNAQKIDINTELDSLLKQFFAICENYPNLKASENFIQFNKQLSSIEDDIVNARKYYNGTVRELNTFLEIFPTNLIAMIFKIEKENFFQMDEIERQTVKVNMHD